MARLSMRHRISPFIRWLDQIHDSERPIVGGKAANLARLIQGGFACPPGFCITTEAFELYLETSGLRKRILTISQESSRSNIECASEISRALQKVRLPEKVEVAAIEAYHEMERAYGKTPVAIRSSALIEDLESVSFAGQFDSFLGIISENDLIDSIKKCWISLFNSRSIAYAQRKCVSGMPLAMAVVVQNLVKAKTAGVMFTVHPVTLEQNLIVIEATFGLGEQLVSGRVSPDTYVLSKDDFTVVERNIVEKSTAIIFDSDRGKLVERKVDPNLQNVPALNAHELVKLTQLGKQIEAFFGKPQDIEWAQDDVIHTIQSRPITVL